MDTTAPSAVPVGVLRPIRVTHTHTWYYHATIMTLSYGLRNSMATQKSNSGCQRLNVTTVGNFFFLFYLLAKETAAFYIFIQLVQTYIL